MLSLFATYRCFTNVFRNAILELQNGCDLMANVGKNISKLRRLKGLTQDELAEKLFVTRQTVSGWENGRTQPALDILGELSDVLDCSPLDIIGSSKKPTRSLFVALIYENEELFYKKSKEILHSDYLCEIAIKNTILSVFEIVDKLDKNNFIEFFTKTLKAECNKLLNEKGSESIE